LAGQPAMSVAIELQAERAPSRHAQIDQAQLGIGSPRLLRLSYPVWFRLGRLRESLQKPSANGRDIIGIGEDWRAWVGSNEAADTGADGV
jgi:hypothetical protein